MPYTLTHPDSPNEIQVETEQVPLYLAQGWQTKPSAPTPKDPDPGPIVTVLVPEKGPEMDVPPIEPKK